MNAERCKVVVVDDALLMRRIIARLCNASAVMTLVGTAADGPTGVSTVLEARPSLAIVDLDLPGFDGLEVSRQICAETGADRPRIIMWSGKDAPRPKMLEHAGVDAFIRKDEGIQSLLVAAQAQGSR